MILYIFKKKSIEKYILDKNIEFIVFDDSKDKIITEKIKNKCLELNISYIRINQNIHIDRNLVFLNPITDIRKEMMKHNKEINFHNFPRDVFSAGFCHCSSVQFIFNYLINNTKYSEYILFNLDSDMFFINYLSINKYIGDNHISFHSQGQLNHIYIWPNVFIFNLSKCENLNEICWDGCTFYKDNKGYPTDTGGETAEYLEKYYKDNNLIKSLICLHIGDNLHDDTKNDLKKFIKDDKNEETINFLEKLKEYSGIIDKDFIMIYNNSFTIIHLRRSTYSDSYLKNKEIVDKFLKSNLN